MDIESSAIAAIERLKLRCVENNTRWNVASAIVLSQGGSFETVAIGCGLKCLPFSAAAAAGDDAVKDAHAEVLCRRAFLRYLTQQLKHAAKGDKSIFSICSERDTQFPFVLNDGIAFHMYVSQSPCGDASTESLDSSQTSDERCVNEAKRRKFESNNDIDKAQYSLDALQNKAKETLRKDQNIPPQFISAQSRGPVLRGRHDYTQKGVLRTKPGRVDSEMSLCMSCSDKMCKWNVLGISGSLLSLLAAPVYIRTIVVGDWFDKDALNRALIGRADGIKNLPIQFQLNAPQIRPSKLPFAYSKTSLESSNSAESSRTPSDVCLAWSKGFESKDALQHLSNNGRKQGHAKRKGVWMDSSRSQLCNKNLANAFIDLVKVVQTLDLSEGRSDCEHSDRRQDNCPPVLKLARADGLSYAELKELNTAYSEARSIFLGHEGFKGWVLKSEPKELLYFPESGTI
ncbi:tRNA-specific adenosine deaminase 1 [Chytriomyces hyalinus]|nr:tRNA-specific adenosine deaminase 1 [Chytriomyces hyalinus]